VVVPLYGVMLGGLTVLMWIAALVVGRVAGRTRRLLLALVGNEGDADVIPVDPPITARLAESVAFVDHANAVFPRGLEFPHQVDRPGFRADWTTLDAATRTLEGVISNDFRIGLGVASAATATAADARSRLNTLRGLAVAHGQAWVGA
jgi:hypothetical protein